MELEVLKISGDKSGRKINLADDVFAIEPNDHAIYLDVKRYMAAQRQGTHKAKEKNEVAFSTKKLKKQKGSGSARYGSRKSPIFRKGGRIFGPRPRKYDIKINKKVRLLARLSALTYKAKGNAIMVLEDFNFSEPKTKNMIGLTSNLKINNKKALIVINELDHNLILSSRNISDVKVVTVSDLTTYDIMNASVVLFNESAINTIASKN